jgi:sterol desaturase/sphingolipid hydroxylase (fatty acid hydroxylase superfamily)
MLREYVEFVGSVLVIALAFRALELRAPAERGQSLSGWLFNVAYIPVALAFAFLLNLLFLIRVYAHAQALAGGGVLPEFGGGGGGAAGQVLLALTYFILSDLCQYAMHRLQRSVPFLWETHKFHHSEVAFNSSMQGRVHPLQYLVGGLFHLPVVILFGARVPHFVAAFLAFRLWGFFNHTNLRVGLGPLTPFLSGPQWHRIHHSISAEHYDKNFAAFFPIIDILFGTYYRPRRGEYPLTGLSGGAVPPLRRVTVEPFLVWDGMLLRRLRGPCARASQAGGAES